MNEIAPIDNYDRARNCILVPQTDQAITNIGTTHVNNEFLIYQDPNGECKSISITQEQLAELGIPLHSYQNLDVGYQIAANNVRTLILDESKKMTALTPNNERHSANVPGKKIEIIEDKLLPSTFVINPQGTPINANSILSSKPAVQTDSNISNSIGDINLSVKHFSSFNNLQRLQQNAKVAKVNVCKKRIRTPKRDLKKMDRRNSNNGNLLTNSSLNKALNEGVPIAVPAHSNILPVQIQNGSTEKLTKSAPTHTTIHLLQNGEKFHSLEKLQGEQLKFVGTALNSVGNPIKNKNYVMFDPDTKTRIIYRIVYPEDLKLDNEESGVGKAKAQTDKSMNTPKNKTKENAEIPTEKSPKVVLKTRSGRAVKVPRHMEDSIEPLSPTTTPYVANPRRKIHVLRCSHCLQSHRGAKKLNQHYEEFPDHKPQTQLKSRETTEQPLFNSNISLAIPHVDLFDCLMKIVNSTLAESRAVTFITQVELLIQKLKNLMPSIVGSKADGGSEESKCTINKDVSKILDVPPGEYNLNFEVLNSVMPDMSSKPVQNVPKEVVKTHEIISKPSQFWVSKHNEENISISDNESEMECSRTNSIDKWPKIKNKWSVYNQYDENSPKKVKGQSEPIEWLSNTVHEMTSGKCFSAQKQMKIPISEADWLPQDIHDIDITTSVFSSADLPDNITSCSSVLSFSDLSDSIANMPYTSDCINVHMKPITSNAQSKGTHIDETVPRRNSFEFHSSHFNIRSSPLKTEQATSFNKIQINNELLPSYIKLTEQENAPISFKQISSSVLNNSSVNCSLQATHTTDVLHSSPLMSPANHLARGNGKMTLETLAETISGYPIKSDSLDLNMVSARDLNHMKAFSNSVLSNSSPDCTLRLTNNTNGLTGLSVHRSPLISPGNHHPASDNSKSLSLDTLADSIGAYPIKSMNSSLDLDMVSTSELNHIKAGNGKNHNQSAEDTRMVDRLTNHLETQLERKDSLLASVSDTQLNASNILTDGISEMQLRRTEALLSVNETSLDGSRLGLSSGQSDLQLLDTLGNDCLSFSDSELRATSQMSLDLPLDLFPFHHS